MKGLPVILKDVSNLGIGGILPRGFTSFTNSTNSFLKFLVAHT